MDAYITPLIKVHLLSKLQDNRDIKCVPQPFIHMNNLYFFPKTLFTVDRNHKTITRKHRKYSDSSTEI